MAISFIGAIASPQHPPAPEEIRHFETVWIPMPDGVRLAAQCTPLEQTVSGEIGALEELEDFGSLSATRSRS
jgi:hypothetical protein